MSEPSEPLEAEIVEERAARGPEPAPAPVPDYDEHGVPSFDYVRDKIEKRDGTAIGAGELAEDTVEGRNLEQQEAERERAAKAKLEEIRRSLGRSDRTPGRDCATVHESDAAGGSARSPGQAPERLKILLPSQTSGSYLRSTTRSLSGISALSVILMCSGQTSVQHLVMLQ